MKRNILFLVIAGIITYIATTGSGCENDPAGPVTTTDTNVKVYSGLVLTQFTDTASLSALNLLTGQVVSYNSGFKDIVMIDSAGSGTNYYLRSGDKNLDAVIGYETRFKMVREYTNITKAQFDTVSRIKNIGSSAPTLSDFDIARTSDYADLKYVTPPLANKMVYSFYLKGKKELGVTTYPVWGLLHLEEMYTSGNLVRLKVNVKINTRGHNQFLREVPVATN